MKKALSLAIVLSCLYFATRGVEREHLWAVLTAARGRYLFVAVFFLIASYYVRGLRWQSLFPAKVRERGLHYLFPTMMIGYFGNNLLPARGGEIARVILMGRHNEISRAGVLSTIFMERTFDGLLLSLMGWLAIRQLRPEGLQWINRVGLVFTGIFLGALALGYQRKLTKAFLTWISSKFPGHLPGIVVQKLHCMLDYLEEVTTSAGLLRIALLSVSVWILEVGVYASVAESLGVWLSPSQLGVFVAAVNFASLVPTSPGGVGTIELVGTEALVSGGLERGTAFAMVVAQHTLQYIFCLLLGGYYTHRLGFSLRGVPTSLRSRTLLNVDDLIAGQAGTHQEAVRHFQATAPRNEPHISMVIPAYNEENRILPTLLSVTEYFHRTRFSYEVIVVDDGSQDETARLVQELQKRFPSIRLIRLPRNMGKGAAVRTGIRNATGHFILFNDADGATPVAEMERLLLALEQGADVAVGSRALYSPETRVERKWGRAVIGRVFAFLVNAWAVPGIADTQCGFKMFRREAAHRIFEIQQLDGFAFDVEVLRIASVLGYRVTEVPINWTHVRGSKIRPVRDPFRMVQDVLRVRYLVPSSLGATSRDIAAPSEKGSSAGNTLIPK